MNEISEATIKNLLSDGVEMGNALRLLKRRLHAVGAGLLSDGKGGWRLIKLVSSLKKEDSEFFATFSQAFDAALSLLIERSGKVNSTVTKSADVAKMMGGEKDESK